MTKRYIGSALTNSNGIATFEYPGQGNGKTKIVAQVGEIELKPYQFTDYLIYDSGIDANHDWSVKGNPTITTTSGYTEITTNGTTTAEIIYNTELTGDFQVSVEVQALDTIRLSLYCDNDHETRFMAFDNRFLLYQIRRVNGIVSTRITSDYGQTWHDMTSYEANTVENNPCKFRFWIPVPQGNTARTLRFRNLRIQKSMDDSYTPITVINSLTVSTDKLILSEAHSDKAVITAVLDGSNVMGKTITFKKGSTVLYTTTTDINGIATYTYESQGAGDITITAECAEFSDDVDIEDCLYAPKLNGAETIHQIHGTTTIANNEMYGGGGYIGAFDNTGNWEITFNGKLENNNCAVMVIKSDETIRDNNEIISPWESVWYYVNGQSTALNFTNRLEYNTYYSYKITKNGNTITFEVNGNTISFNWSLATTLPTLGIGIDNWGNGGTAYIKDIKVKPLPTPSSLSVTVDNDVLSYVDGDEATISATLTGGTVSGQSVVFKNGSTVLATETTDSNGVAEYIYSSQGVGDVTITVECGELQETYELEDCQYYNITEKSFTGTQNHQLYDSNLSVALSNPQEISFDAKIGTTSTNKDYRFWFLPKSQFNGMNYPSCTMFFDKKPSTIYLGKTENGTGTNLGTYNIPSNPYVRFKYIVNGTDVQLYADDVLILSFTLSCIQNYSDWTISVMTWSGEETRYLKNVKFKPL